MYLSFVNHCIWGVLFPVYICPFLFQYMIPETYKPLPLEMAFVLCHKQVDVAIAYLVRIM